MKLSSTMKTSPRYPSLRSASSSARTCAGCFTRGTRPKISMMSQNSHMNGQPREVWMHIERYCRTSSRSSRGTGTSCRDGRAAGGWRTRPSHDRPSMAATSASTRPSASPRNRQSASSNRSGEVVHAGPPNTVRRPSSLDRARISCIDCSCTSMPLESTTSAQRRSSSRNAATFVSTKRISHARGNSAATEISPSGGSVARLPMIGRLC